VILHTKAMATKEGRLKFIKQFRRLGAVDVSGWCLKIEPEVDGSIGPNEELDMIFDEFVGMVGNDGTMPSIPKTRIGTPFSLPGRLAEL